MGSMVKRLRRRRQDVVMAAGAWAVNNGENRAAVRKAMAGLTKGLRALGVALGAP